MTIIKRNISIAVAALVVVSLFAVVAVAQTGGDASSPGEGVPQVSSIEAEAKQAMDVLDEPRTSGDALPADVAESIDEHPQFGMNPDLSRESIETISSDVHVIPANDHVCGTLTVGDGANITCARTEDIAAGEAGPATVTLEAGGIAIYGLVPNGVRSVTLKTAAGSHAVDVEDNAYYTVVPKGTALGSLSYTGPSGLVEFALYDPSKVFDR